MATVVAGDFNCHNDTLEMDVFRLMLPWLADTWQACHPDEPGYTANICNIVEDWAVEGLSICQFLAGSLQWHLGGI